MRPLDRSLALTVLTLGAVVCAGCNHTDRRPIKALTRPMTGINRVVLVELSQRNSYPGVARDMTTALSHAVQARGLFGLDVIDRDDPICQSVSMVGREGLTIEQISEMHQAFKCDGILLGAISDFRPHPRMQLGVSLRLLDLKRGRVVWAIDHVWDTTDKAVERRIQRYFRDYMRSGYKPMDWQIAMISPKVFEKFIAHEMAQTLPEPLQARAGRKRGR